MNYTNEELATAIEWSLQQATSLRGIKDAHDPWAKVAKMLEDRKSQDARIAELTAEVGRYEACLEALQFSARVALVPGNDKKRELELILNTISQAIARNALKDGV